MIEAPAPAVHIRTIEAFAANLDANALVWWNGSCSGLFTDVAVLAEVEAARLRFRRFAPVLAKLFPGDGWDGAIASRLMRLDGCEDKAQLWAKCDHALPIAGSVKARGGIHEVLKYVETLARQHGMDPDDSGFADGIVEPSARRWLSGYSLLVGSTGNLGYGVGVAARAFGLQVEVHMSSDAKAWKKERLRAFGVAVVEHGGDFTEAVAEARRSAAGQTGCHFVDDENSRDLLVGYAVAARELAAQLEQDNILPSAGRPLIVYIPCGVGGAAGGIALGLKAIFGQAVLTVVVEPIASACMMAARLNDDRAVSVYDFGLHNQTIADGLAVPCASQLVLDVAAACIDAAVAVRDEAMLSDARRLWADAGLKLEPSAAAGFSARAPFRAIAGDTLRAATELVWTTGGQLMPEHEFAALIA